MKNNYFKILIVSALIVSLLCNGCMTEKKRAELAKNLPLTETKWKLQTMKGKPVADSPVHPYITFKADGRYEGNLGCNSCFGNYYVRKNHIRMNYEGATKRLCNDMKVEKELMLNLHNDFRWFEIRTDTLFLKDNKKNEILMFIAEKKEKPAETQEQE